MAPKKWTSMITTYANFFSNFNVLGLAIGLMIGTSLKEVAGDFIDGIIMPFIRPIIARFSTKDGVMLLVIPNTSIVLNLEKVVASSIKFSALSVLIFLLIQAGIKVKKPLQWVSVRNWNERCGKKK